MSRKASTNRTTARTAAPMVLFFRGLSPTPYSRESWAGGASGGGAAWALALRSLKGWKPSKALPSCPAWALGPKPLRGCWAVWPGWPAAWAGPGFLALGSGVKAIRSGPLSWGTPVWGWAVGCAWACGWLAGCGPLGSAAPTGSALGWGAPGCWGAWAGWAWAWGWLAGCGLLGSAAPAGSALGWGASGCWGAWAGWAWVWGWPAGCGLLGSMAPTGSALGWGVPGCWGAWAGWAWVCG